MSQEKGKLTTCQLHKSNLESISMENLAKVRIKLYHQQGMSGHHTSRTQIQTLTLAICYTVSRKLRKTGKKMALGLILPEKTLEEDKERISVEHNYCTPLTPIEPVEPEGNGSTVSTELLSPVKCHPVKCHPA